MIGVKWFQRKWRAYVVLCLLIMSYNLYFIFLMQTTRVEYLLYLDLLVLVFLTVVEGTAFFDFWKRERRKRCFCRRMS